MTSQADRLITLGVELEPKPGGIVLNAQSAEEAVEWAHRNYVHDSCKVELVVSKQWSEDHPGETDAVRNALKQIEETARIAQKTIEDRSMVIARSFAQNLSRVEHWATDMDEPFKGVPVFIVGAGSSLDKNAHLIPEAAKRGYVVAVNTSAGAVREYADAVVCVESRDVSRGLELGPKTVHILDVCSGPENWDVSCDLQLGFINHSPTLAIHGLSAGTHPIPYVGTVVAAAWSLAHTWGASPVVLVGEDLAYLPPDRFYAERTAYEDVRWRFDEEDRLIHFTSEHKPMPPTKVLGAPAWGGEGFALTNRSLLDYAWLFGRMAEHSPAINASEAGVRIPNTEEATLVEVIKRYPEIDKQPLSTPPEVSTAMEVQRIKRGLRAVLDAPDKDLVAAAWEVSLMGSVRVRSQLMITKQGKLSPADRRRKALDDLREGARELLEVM